MGSSETVVALKIFGLPEKNALFFEHLCGAGYAYTILTSNVLLY